MTVLVDQAVAELEEASVPTRVACEALGLSQAGWYRRHRQSPPPPVPERVRAPQPRALTEVEHKELRATLNSEEFCDDAPATAYAKLLDQGIYLASVPTMYRVLRSHDEVGDRRRHATHPAKKKPELIAAAPNEVWSWDITKLRPGQVDLLLPLRDPRHFQPLRRGLDAGPRRTLDLAKALIAETVARKGVKRRTSSNPDADRARRMTSKPFALLLADLGSPSPTPAPRTSNDNPYSESQFRTMKYRPDYPERFGGTRTPWPAAGTFSPGTTTSTALGHRLPHARGRPLRTGRSVRQQRGHVLDAAYAAHPERFVRRPPAPPALPTAVWINKPEEVSPSAQ